jgi:hypothetical protein
LASIARAALLAKPETLNFIPNADSVALWLRELTQVGAGARVFKANMLMKLFAGLTFEVTCTRQRDTLARQGIMSIARTAGQVWHAVARQVHRMVRPHS